MEKYNYRESVMDCIIDYIKENNIVVTLENRIDLE